MLYERYTILSEGGDSSSKQHSVLVPTSEGGTTFNLAGSAVQHWDFENLESRDLRDRS